MAGAAASSAEQAKRRKYENLDSSFIFVPFGVETLGPWGPEARALFKELSKRVIESTGDPRAGSYLGQRIKGGGGVDNDGVVSWSPTTVLAVKS
ncbi:jg20834 [Pararge aegeria aegeria]|uniref:Jg20834 protein n=1 Tax=Pararge aegeria aegeria TaxID=348720 RepID=A0A8S4QLZ1_9NEOP|nr:jg20834 [Pararge aegeria aegeria]